jgi:hypothetical protein
MSYSYNAFNHKEWDAAGLEDYSDFSEKVEYYNQRDCGDHTEGSWFYVGEKPLPEKDGMKNQFAIYHGTFGNYNSPGASSYTNAEVYDLDDPEEKAEFEKHKAELEAKEEYLETDDEEEDDSDEDEEEDDSDEDEEGDVRAAFEAFDENKVHHPNRLQVDYEHGGWFVTCLDCGAQFSAHEAEKNGEDTYDFDEVTHGDESCLDAAREESSK